MFRVKSSHADSLIWDLIINFSDRCFHFICLLAGHFWTQNYVKKCNFTSKVWPLLHFLQRKALLLNILENTIHYSYKMDVNIEQYSWLWSPQIKHEKKRPTHVFLSLPYCCTGLFSLHTSVLFHPFFLLKRAKCGVSVSVTAGCL